MSFRTICVEYLEYFARSDRRFYWTGGAVCTLEGLKLRVGCVVDGRVARQRRPERSAVVTCSRSVEWSTFHPVIYFSRVSLLSLKNKNKNKRARFQKYLNISSDQNRSVTIIFEENNESVNSDSLLQCSILCVENQENNLLR